MTDLSDIKNLTNQDNATDAEFASDGFELDFDNLVATLEFVSKEAKAKAVAEKLPPYARAKRRFIDNAEAAITDINNGKASGGWFRLMEDGRYKVMVKSSGKAIELVPGKSVFKTRDAASAINAIGVIAVACHRDLLESHIRANLPPERVSRDIDTDGLVAKSSNYGEELLAKLLYKAKPTIEEQVAELKPHA